MVLVLEKPPSLTLSLNVNVSLHTLMFHHTLCQPLNKLLLQPSAHGLVHFVSLVSVLGVPPPVTVLLALKEKTVSTVSIFQHSLIYITLSSLSNSLSY